MKKFKLVLTASLLFLIAVNIQAQSSGEDIKKKILEAYDFFNTRDVTKDKAMKFIDENYTDHTPDPGQMAGIEGLVQSFANLKKGFPDYKITIKEIVVNTAESKAGVHINITGTNTGEMMGMPPTGKKVDFDGLDLLVFKNGKCSERWGYFDTMKMMQQLGLMK